MALPNFGYPNLYTNGINSNSQIRRSTDMIYQRGGTYEIILTGDTYLNTIQMNVDMYVSDNLVGRMNIVPYSTQQSGSIYFYKFNVRPYYYLQNFVENEHYKTYTLNDWSSSNQSINWNISYTNSIKANFKYGWSYVYSGNTVAEYGTANPSNDYNHFTAVPICAADNVPNALTNTGNYFNYIGGVNQFDEKFYLPNYDQELGSVMGTGSTINTTNLTLSPISQFLMDYPSVPEQSETGRFLTNAPRVQYIQPNENFVLSYLNGQTGDRQVIEADYIVFEFFDFNNNKLSHYEAPINTNGNSYASPVDYTDNLSIFSIPVGPVDINNIFTSIDFSTVAYYTAQICYGYPTNVRGTISNSTYAVGPISEVFYFYLYNNCLPENTRICFLNQKGGFDYYTFQSYRQDSKKITSSTFDSRYYATNLQSPDRDFGRTLKTYDINIDREIVVDSQYLNLSYANWLEELFISPQVYLVNEDYISPLDSPTTVYKDLIPLQVISSQVDKITKKHSKMNKYKITFKIADTFFTNKGF